MSYFEAYGETLARIDDPTIAAGRYTFQDPDEIVADVIRKLDPQPHHRLLEIGFGSGQLLLPLAEIVYKAVGIDHTAAVGRLVPPNNVTLVPGRWPDVPISGEFDRILAYSVLQYAQYYAVADRFLNAAVLALAPDGILMVGDIPNPDAARRFTRGAAGREVLSSWQKQIDQSANDDLRVRDEIFTPVECEALIDDSLIMLTLARYRRFGYDTYILPQPMGPPFFHGREDLIIHRSAA